MGEFDYLELPETVIYLNVGAGVIINLVLFFKFKEAQLRKHPANFFVMAICLLNIVTSLFPFVLEQVRNFFNR